MKAARLKVLLFDQSIHFPDELKNLKVNKPIFKRSKIAFLRPFIDESGLLRVGSRLEECPYMAYSEKFPVILARRSKLSVILAWDFHRIFLDGGPQLIHSALSRKYFLVCGKRVVRSVTSKCSQCLGLSGRLQSQQMACLPPDRLVYEYQFATTSLDYAGSIKVTPSRGRGITSSKGYICIFIV